MKNTFITEFVKIEALQTTTEKELVAKANIVNEFLEKQDGFMDAELVKALEGNTWYFIYHIESLEKLKSIGEKLRANKLFDHITPLVVPGSLQVSFYRQFKNW